MSPRLAFNVLALGAIAATTLAKRPALVNDLRGPTALAHVEGPRGGFRLLVAESEPPRVIELTLIGQSVISRRTIGLIDQPAVGLSGYDGRAIAAGVDGVVALRPGAGPSFVAGPETALLGPLARDQRWLFVPSDVGLLRSRIASGRVMDLRRVAERAAAATLSPDGYLVTLSEGPQGGWRLAYRDPGEPATAFTSFQVAGLGSPIAVASRPTDSTLYVLESVGSIARIDRTLGEARHGALATPIAGPASATAIAFAGDGALYLTTDSGELRRLEREL